MNRVCWSKVSAAGDVAMPSSSNQPLLSDEPLLSCRKDLALLRLVRAVWSFAAACNLNQSAAMMHRGDVLGIPGHCADNASATST